MFGTRWQQPWCVVLKKISKSIVQHAAVGLTCWRDLLDTCVEATKLKETVLLVRWAVYRLCLRVRFVRAGKLRPTADGRSICMRVLLIAKQEYLRP